MEIHIRRKGKGMGPYSPEEAREALARNELTPADEAWHSGLSHWQALGTILEASDLKPQGLTVGSPSPRPAGKWEVLCPQCVKIIGTPASLFCPNCHGPLELEGGFTTRLKCVRCSTAVTDVRCDTCKSLASGNAVR